MPILPLIDLLVLLGTMSLGAGFIVKAITLTTVYKPLPLGLAPLDFLIIAGVFFVFALTLTARTWMKLNEPRLFAARREAAAAQARLRAAEHDLAIGEEREPRRAAADFPEMASADRR